MHWNVCFNCFYSLSGVNAEWIEIQHIFNTLNATVTNLTNDDS